MKDEDVRIGMKVVPHDKTAGEKGLKKSTIWEVKDDSPKYLYVRGKNEGSYILSNKENYGSAELFNACDFEPYVDIELMAEQLSKAIDNLKDTLYQQFQPIIDFVAKNKDTFEKLVEESKEEKLEKEITEAFDEYTNKVCSYSLQACFRDGFLAGRESK